MRWYVSRNGEIAGPVEEAQVIEWVKGGMRDGTVRDEAGGPWTPLEQSRFAPPGSASAGGSEALGTIIVLVPLVSTALVWFWIGSMNPFQDPGLKLGLLIPATALGTGVLIAIEASQLGMGKRSGSDGKNELGPIVWFFACWFAWLLAFPWYLHRRRFFGRRSLGLAGLFFAGIFLLSAAIMIGQIQTKRALVTHNLGALGTHF
jgi:hypothetical protein